MSATSTPELSQVMATIQQLMEQQALMLQAIADNSKSKVQLTDTRGIGKPGILYGDQAKYKEWMLKLNAYLRSVNPAYTDWIQQLIIKNEEINETMMQK